MPSKPKELPARKLFIVDDDEGILFLMSKALEKEGYSVDTAEDGKKALMWLERNSADLMLLDHNLGSLSASALLEDLKNRGRNIPFVIITGQGDERIAVQMMKGGALDYVMKDRGIIDLLPNIVHRALAVVDRKKELFAANETIREREKRQQHIIHTALDGFARFDLNVTFLEVNRALCELLEETSDRILKKRLFDFVEDAFVDVIQKRILSLKGGNSVRFGAFLRTKNGRQIEVEISLRCEKREMFAFFHDVSVRRKLEREVLQISEDERRRIGRELHDSLGQELTALEFMSQTLAHSLESKIPDLSVTAKEISLHIRAAVTQVRRLSHGLAPLTLVDGRLGDALAELTHTINASGMTCELSLEISSPHLDSIVATNLYRIAQEAVTNALKHASAQYLVLRLHELSDVLELSIQDDGNGMKEKDERNGMGLQVMNYRARLIRAQLRIDSNPKNGVRIVCSLPKKNAFLIPNAL